MGKWLKGASQNVDGREGPERPLQRKGSFGSRLRSIEGGSFQRGFLTFLGHGDPREGRQLEKPCSPCCAH